MEYNDGVMCVIVEPTDVMMVKVEHEKEECAMLNSVSLTLSVTAKDIGTYAKGAVEGDGEKGCRLKLQEKMESEAKQRILKGS